MSQCESVTETILLVDDDSFLRQCLSDMLVSEGYKVILVEDGLDAVSKYKENVDCADLVLMDVVMPNKDGITAYKEIIEMNPHQRIILMSAYSSTSLGNLDKINFIQKPIHPSKLLNTIREVLDSHRDLPL